MYGKVGFLVLVIAMALTGAPVTVANTMDQWAPWVLEKHPQHDCPWIMDNATDRACIWPGRLILQASDQGASFSYDIDVYRRTDFIRLPGDQTHWPAAVTVDGKPAPILEKESLPHIAIAAGKHTVEGQFHWQQRPGQLAVPQEIAIVSLSINGHSQAVDRRNDQIIFSDSTAGTQKKTSDSLEVEVYRLLNDGIPLTLHTHIKLSVSGKPREVTVGKVMLTDTEVMQIDASIPARIEADGSLRAQVMPGEHSLLVETRYLVSPAQIRVEKVTAEWPSFEYISFRANPAIRQVKLSGPISVDTSQIALPPEWMHYPTYRMGNDDLLTLETELRGDHSPAANELHVNRDLWLDFSGDGVTALDRLGGAMHQGWRLNAAAGNHIGRATVDDELVLITLDKGQEGIEIRSPQINLEAVTRTDKTSRFNAIGWDARADTYLATLHLPPGWRVLHASGVDQILGTWLSQWDLWDVFLMLVVIAATRKLFGNSTAAIASVSFLVALHEQGSPLLIIPTLLVVIALLPVAGKLKSVLRVMGVMVGIILVLSVIRFAVDEFRLAIYPSLERAGVGTYDQRSYDTALPDAASAPAPMMEGVAKSNVMPQSQATEKLVIIAGQEAEDFYQLAENDRVQTGPGLPTWTWNTVNFRSSGPVAANQDLAIVFSPPLVTMLWRVSAVFLVAIYAAIVLARLARLCQFSSAAGKDDGDKGKEDKTNNNALPNANALLMVGVIFFFAFVRSPAATAENYPPQYLLDDLEQRLLKQPECLPHCASLNEGHIRLQGTALTIRFNVYVDADLSLPLPSGHGSWELLNVLANDQPLALRRRNEIVFAHLSKGHHLLTLTGTINGDSATIALPLAIHNLSVDAPNWVVDGLVDGRVRSGTLTLRAQDPQQAGRVNTLKADLVPVFVEVHRRFIFAKKWRVETSVRRIAPSTGALSIAVALLPNEQLLRDMGEVKNGQITVQLGHNIQEIRWISALEPVQQLQLTAFQGGDDKQRNGDYIERWSLMPSSLWRLDYQGIPPVKADADSIAFVPEFKPWPGETLVVTVGRPEGVTGPTHTVEQASLKVDAGNQLQRSTLTLQMRSSLGENYTITLPDDSEVTKFNIDGRAMNIPSGNIVKVPLQPGLQTIIVEFQAASRMGVVNKSPVVILPDGASNVQIQYALPRDRWPLYLKGPAIGPAMLYWGVLCVIVLAAFALPRLAQASKLAMPINTVGWILLGVGLSTVNSYGVLIIAVMFFLLAARKQFINPDAFSRFAFNAMQVVLIVWVVIAVLCMLSAIPMGLLSNPEMKVVGNGSYSHFYNYYQDIVGSEGLPAITVISVPILAYRVVMLLWSLWLATKLIQWAVWVWACWSEKSAWRAGAARKQKRVEK